MAFAIYALEPIGVGGAYEADGDIHYYCCADHAERHAIAEGYATSANFSKPQPTADALPGTVCEWCGEVVQG